MPTTAVLVALAWTLVNSLQPLGEAQRRTEARHHLEAGEASMHTEAFEQAAREFRAAIQLDPLLIMAHYDLGQAHMALKEYRPAVEAYLACRDTLEHLNSLQQGQIVEREHEVEDQIHGLQDLARRVQSERSADPGNRLMMIEARIRMLEGTRAKGNEKQARVPAELYLALGSAYFRLGAIEEAEREYGAAVSSDPKLGSAHNNLAVIYMLTGRFKEAHTAVSKAEKAGFHISPVFKRDLETREASAQQPGR